MNTPTLQPPGAAATAPPHDDSPPAPAPLHWMDWRNDLHLLTDLLPQRVRSFDVERFAASLAHQPCRNTLALVGLATVLFYKAEKGRNPMVEDIWDALVYCTTNMSVGYCDVFAQTPMGKLIGSVLMTFGPSMTAHLLDGPDRERPDFTERQILAALHEILAELRQRDANSGP